MQEDNSFLPLFLQEEIYLIGDEMNESTLENTPENKPESKEEQTPQPAASALPYYGQNGKHVLIVADCFEEAEKTFLSKILQAVRLSFDDVAVVKFPELSDISQLKNIDYQTLLSFGVQQENFLHNFPAYTLQKKGGKQVLLADSLRLLKEDTKKKALLWANLQKVFL